MDITNIINNYNVKKIKKTTKTDKENILRNNRVERYAKTLYLKKK